VPVFEVWKNNESIARAGGDDFDLLTLGIVGGDSSRPTRLQLTGWRKATAEHFQWLNIPFQRQAKISAMLRGSGTTTPGLEKQVWPEEQEQSDSLSLLRLEIGDKQVVQALADNASILYASATWHRAYNACKVEIWSTLISDINQNRFRIELSLDFDQLMIIERKE
jgi:hypothetical protein